MRRRSFLQSLAVPFAALLPAVARLVRPGEPNGFTETYDFSEDPITSGYGRVLLRLLGRRNDASFKGYAAGECLLVEVVSPEADVLTRTRTFTFRFVTGLDPLDKQAHDLGDFSALGIGA